VRRSAVLLGAFTIVAVLASSAVAANAPIDATEGVELARTQQPVDVVSDQDIDEALRQAYSGIRARPNLLALVRERVVEFLASMVERLATATATGVGRVIAVLAGVALVGWLMWFLARRGRLVPERALQQRTERMLERDPARALAEALARGDLKSAVRAQYALLLRELAAHDVIPDYPALTAGECRQAAAKNIRALHPIIDRATGAFERVVYGDSAADHADLDALREATEAVRVA
jgi:hypothetical protein